MENKKTIATILAFAMRSGFDGIKKTNIQYKGYTVYKPYFNTKKTMHSGLPLSILVRDNEIRFTNPDETFEVFDLLLAEKGK